MVASIEGVKVKNYAITILRSIEDQRITVLVTVGDFDLLSRYDIETDLSEVLEGAERMLETLTATE